MQIGQNAQMSADWYIVLTAALLLGTTWYFVRPATRRRRVWLLAVWCLLLFALPWFSEGSTAVRSVVTLACCALIVPKLIDAERESRFWKERPVREWVRYLVDPFVLCYRRHLQDPSRPRGESLRFTLRGAGEVLAGGVILFWAFRQDWTRWPFVVEHAVKLLGVYLLVLDGTLVLANGVLGMLGGRYHTFSRHPILARTPADFWRRYNRDAGRFLLENVYRPLSGRHPMRGIGAVFALNGLLHEYLVIILSHRLAGYQIAFFAIQGAAVAVTWRWRPAGKAAVGSTGLTMVFNVVTAVLFFRGVNLIVPWYAARG